MILCYYPEIDYLFVANNLGIIYLEEKIVKKYGLEYIRNLDLYIIDSDLK